MRKNYNMGLKLASGAVEEKEYNQKTCETLENNSTKFDYMRRKWKDKWGLVNLDQEIEKSAPKLCHMS